MNDELDAKINLLEEKLKPLEREAAHLRQEVNDLKLQKAAQEFSWIVVDHIIDELIAKEDIIETTFRAAIVSYILDTLECENLLKKDNVMGKEIIVKATSEEKYPAEPYAQFKNNPAWSVINQIIGDLVENQDIVETTVRKCIVGYIIKRLTETGLLHRTND